MPFPLLKGAAVFGFSFILAACGGESASESDEKNDLVESKDSVISVRNVTTDECPNGAVEIELGVDSNGNGRLDPDEVDHGRTQTICHGQDGVNGSDGIAGQDGISSLIKSEEASAEVCSNGGTTIYFGFDLDRNDQLEESEVTQTETICNLSSPTFSALVETGVEPKGENCANGGVKIDSGLDLNADGSLGNSEVQSTQYVCHGVHGNDGQDGADGQDGTDGQNGKDGISPDLSNLLIESVEEAAGENCFHGGTKHQIGLDTNGNGQLDSSEIISGSYTCLPNSAPNIYVDAHQEPIVGQPFEFKVNAYDPDENFDDIVTLNVIEKPDWLTVTPISESSFQLKGVVPNLVGSKYEIKIEATDSNRATVKTHEFTALDGIGITITAEDIVEGNSGLTEAEFIVTLSKASYQTLEINTNLSSYSSMRGSDWFTSDPYPRLSFAPGELEKSVKIQVKGDHDVEFSEQVELRISSVTYSGAERISYSEYTYLNVLNDDSNEILLQAGVPNSVALLMSQHRIAESQVELVNAPDWLTISQYESNSNTGDNYQTIRLQGTPAEDLADSSGSFSLKVNHHEQATEEHELNYRIIFEAPDTDNDGLPDQWEVSLFATIGLASQATDFDSDGLTDADEYALGSNPKRYDTDSDGQSDGTDAFVLDPRYTMDSDADGLADEWEQEHFGSLDVATQDSDSDNDGVSDIDEFKQNSSPALDSDNDGVSDFVDLFPNNENYALDADLDGIADEWERTFCLLINPSESWQCDGAQALNYFSKNGDYDQDTRSDLKEFTNSTNPLEKNLTANEDVVAVSLGQSVTFSPISNDIHVDGAQIQVSVAATDVGELTNNLDGTVTYIAPADYIGWLTLNYDITDGEDSDSSTIFIRISDQAVSEVTKIVASSENNTFLAALFDDGSVYTWGDNAQGQLGVGDNDTRLSPTKISSLSNIVDIDLGQNFAVALTADHKVKFWGNNETTPVEISLGTNVIDVAANSDNLNVLFEDGSVVQAFAYGVPSGFSPISGLPVIKAIESGRSHTLALDENGLVWSFGYNEYGQLGNGSFTESGSSAVQVSKVENIKVIEAGYDQSFAIDNDGQLFAWGSNAYYGALGDGTYSNRNVPVAINLDEAIKSVSTAYSHTLVLTETGKVFGMGSTEYNRLGSRCCNNENAPIELFEGTYSLVAAGYSSTHLNTSEHKMYSVGNNAYGQLGNGNRDSSPELVEVDWLQLGLEGILSELGREGFEWGVIPSFWRNVGDQWVVVDEGNVGTYAAKVADSLSDNGTASLGLKLTTAAGDVSFKVKTSTETDYDELVFLIDGVVQDRFSGEQDWTTTPNYPVTAGTHNFEWVYTKDGGTSMGEDTIWLDDIVLPKDTDGDGVLDAIDPEPNNPNL